MAVRQRILVVEKDKSFLEVLETTLRLMGVEACCVLGDWDTPFKVAEDKFDGAFIDWDSPHFDTRDLIRRIRHSAPNAKIPLIVLTTPNDLRAVAEAFEAGATFCLTKPVDAGQLETLLNTTRGVTLEERRKYQRVPLKATVLCAWGQKQEAKRVQGHTLNVSSTGLLMSFTPHPPMGSIVAVELKLPDSNSPLALRGIVTRDGPAHQVAIRFTGLSPEHRELLEKCVSTGSPAS